MHPGSVPPAPAAGRRQLLSVQVLRAVAALSIVVHHAGYDADTLAARFGLAPIELGRIFDWGFGIHLFFVISGLIMVSTARGFGETGAVRRFLERRLVRIVPLYWIMTALVLVGSYAAPSLLNVPVDGWGLLLGSFLFVPVTRINGEIRPILGQGWTLNYEIFFYIVFAASMALPRRRGLAILTAALVGFVVAGRLLSPESAPLIVWTSELLLEFLFGVGIGLALSSGRRLSAPAAWMLVVGGLAAAVMLGPAGGEPGRHDILVSEGVPAAIVVAGCVLAAPWPSLPLVAALAAIGDASYSLYLTQPFTIRLLRAGWAVAVGDRLPVVVFTVVAGAASVLASILVFRWIERPMTALLQHRFRRPAPTYGGKAPVEAV